MSNVMELEKLLRQGGISRREFLARSAAIHNRRRPGDRMGNPLLGPGQIALKPWIEFAEIMEAGGDSTDADLDTQTTRGGGGGFEMVYKRLPEFRTAVFERVSVEHRASHPISTFDCKSAMEADAASISVRESDDNGDA